MKQKESKDLSGLYWRSRKNAASREAEYFVYQSSDIRVKIFMLARPWCISPAVPGVRAVSMLRVKGARELFKKIAATHDVILLEQRGTQLCEPTLYWPSPESFPDDIFASEQRALEVMRQRGQQAMEFFRAQGADITGYTSIENADDIEALRQALGVRKLSLLGFSYGTHLTLTTVKRHESNLDRVVLVGTEGLDQTLKYPSVYDKQLEMLSDLVAGIPPENTFRA